MENPCLSPPRGIVSKAGLCLSCGIGWNLSEGIGSSPIPVSRSFCNRTTARRRGQLSVTNVLFFVVLLTMLVTLYDRYRQVYLMRFSELGRARWE